MMTASSIRKQLLNLFDQGLRLLDSFSEATPALVLGQPPFQFSPSVKLRPLPIELLQSNKATGELVQHWEHACVNATEWVYLIYLAEGEADFRIGVTQEMAATLKLTGQEAQAGCWIVSLRAPAFILFPSGVPYSNAKHIFWERAEPCCERAVMTFIHLMPGEALCNFGVREGQDYRLSHPLMIKDPLLIEAERILYDELRHASPDGEAFAQAQLKIILGRIKRRLAVERPVIANTTWSSPPLNKAFVGTARDTVLLSDLHEYMHVHLREPLSLSQIADRAELSISHLNRIFRRNLGVSVMQYMIQLRMESARQILYDSPHYSIKEVMVLVGYSDLAHFSRAFSGAYGIAPRKYRDRRRKEIAA
jgi:AraC-like DNA-binding protein